MYAICSNIQQCTGREANFSQGKHTFQFNIESYHPITMGFMITGTVLTTEQSARID